jgi:hypothetical protein
MNWSNVADEPIRIQHMFEGSSTSINEAASTRRPSQIKVFLTIFRKFRRFAPFSHPTSTSALSQSGPSSGF